MISRSRYYVRIKLNMFNQDILLQVTSRLNNQSLRVLSQTSLWNDIKKFADSTLFWKLRVENLIGRDIDLSSDNWKKVYYILEKALKKEDPLRSVGVLDITSLKILFNLGYRYTPRLFKHYPSLATLANENIDTLRLFLALDYLVHHNSSYREEAIELALMWSQEDSKNRSEQLLSLAMKIDVQEIMAIILDYIGGIENGDEALLRASSQYRTDTVRALISHPLVNLSNEALQLSYEKAMNNYSYSQTTSLLIRDSRMNLDSLMKTVGLNKLFKHLDIDAALGFYKYRQKSIYTLGYYRSLALALFFKRPTFEEALKWIVLHPNKEMRDAARDLIDDRRITHKSDLYAAYRGFLLHAVFENIDDIRQVLLEEGARPEGIDLASALTGALLRKKIGVIRTFTKEQLVDLLE